MTENTNLMVTISQFVSENWILVSVWLGSLVAAVVHTIRDKRITPFMISPQKVVEMINEDNKLLIVDLRDEKERSQGHIQNARKAVAATLSKDDQLAEQYPDHNIVLTCQNGNASHFAFRQILFKPALAKALEGRLFMLDGGIESWQEQGLPLQKGDLKSLAG